MRLKQSVYLTLLCLLLALPAAAQEDACYAKNGVWNADEARCDLQSGVTVNVVYPVELIGTGVAETTVDNFLNETRAAFIESYTPVWSLPAYVNNWALNITYELFRFSDDVQSIKFDLSDYTGGAHPNLNFQTFTFDLVQQRVLALEDIFADGVNPWPTLAPIVEQNVIEQLGEAADPTWIHDGTGENPDNYRNFALMPGALVFFFPPYQVTAYAYGPVTVKIPLSKISGLLKPELVSQP
ncbi:MAG: DUF3298 domain-containing protein [Chloroflexi bacterium]|nr:DUF3298 domain-containing protein [Chloroflexota bacterium]